MRAQALTETIWFWAHRASFNFSQVEKDYAATLKILVTGSNAVRMISSKDLLQFLESPSGLDACGRFLENAVAKASTPSKPGMEPETVSEQLGERWLSMSESEMKAIGATLASTV